MEFFKISIKNKSFKCSSDQTIFEAAKLSNIFLEHSCLSGRCNSCVAKVNSGTFRTDKLENDLRKIEHSKELYTCCSYPKSDINLEIEDLSEYNLNEKLIYPSKINKLQFLNDNVVELILRFPPNVNFKFNPGQYVNLIRGNIKRSYSISSYNFLDKTITFLIKKYNEGKMSNFLFNQAKENDLLRVEGPIGSFFLRNSDKKNIIFLCTGTGIAPALSMIKEIKDNFKKYNGKKIFLIWGNRFYSDFFKVCDDLLDLNYTFVKVLSREKTLKNKDYKGYVQEALIGLNLNLNISVVYACGSENMIESSKKLLITKGLNENCFFSDAFTISNQI